MNKIGIVFGMEDTFPGAGTELTAKFNPDYHWLKTSGIIMSQQSEKILLEQSKKFLLGRVKMWG